MHSVKRVNFPVLLLFFSVVLELVFLIWAAGRGFDFRDEGFCVMRAAMPKDIGATLASEYLINSFLLWVGLPYLGIRKLGVLLVVLSSFMLGGVVGRCNRLNGWNVILLGVVGASGGLLYYYRLHPAPTYNLWAAIFLNICAAFGVAILFGKKVNLNAFLLGVFLFLLLLNKPSTGVVFVVLIVFAIALTGKVQRIPIVLGVIVLTDLVLGMCLSFGVEYWMPTIRRGVSQMSVIGEGIERAGLLSRFFTDVGWLLTKFVRSYLWWVAALVVFGKFFPFIRRFFRWFVLFGVLIVSAVISNGFQGGQGAYREVILGVLGFIFLPFCLFWGAKPMGVNYLKFGKKRTGLGLAALLVGVPFAGAFGTGNLLYANLCLHLAPWFILCGLNLLYLNDKKFSQVWISCLLIASISFNVTGALRRPQALIVGVVEQNTPLDIDVLGESVLVDASTAVSITRLRNLLVENGFSTGDRVIALCDMPGVVASLGGRSPSGAWFFSERKIQNSKQRSEVSIAGWSESSHVSFVLLDNRERTRKAIPDLNMSIIGFPQNFKAVGSVDWVGKKRGETKITIWKRVKL